GQFDIREDAWPAVREVIEYPSGTRDELPRIRKAAQQITLEDGPDAMPEVAFAHARDWGIHGHDEGRISRRARSRHRRFRDITAPRDVQLKPERAARRLTDFLEPCAGKSREDVRGSRFIGCAGGVQFTFRIEHAAEADGGKEEWQVERGAQHSRSEI